MRRLALSSLLLALVVMGALDTFAHAGEVHNYMGTVAAVNGDGSFTLKKTDATTMQVFVSTRTAYLHADGKPATRADLTAGKRVVATISKDGKTATTIKLARRTQ